MTSRKKTGVADDNQWLYIDNYCYHSDMSGREQLVDIVKIGGKTYNDIEITDTEYDGDTVFMCVTYATDDDVW